MMVIFMARDSQGVDSFRVVKFAVSGFANLPTFMLVIQVHIKAIEAL